MYKGRGKKGADGAAAAGGCSGASEPGCSTADCTLKESGRVDTRLDDAVASRLRHVREWRGLDNPWIYNATEEARRAKRRAREFGPFGGGRRGGGGGRAGAGAVGEEEWGASQDINLLPKPAPYTGSNTAPISL